MIEKELLKDPYWIEAQRQLLHQRVSEVIPTKVEKRKKKVFVYLKETSQAIEHFCINTYTKDGFYCIYTMEDGDKKIVYKYPILNIWRVKEDY